MHTIKNKVEASYRRGDLFLKRQRLMDAWGEYCASVSNSKGKLIEMDEYKMAKQV